ncbi:MAG TPA: TIR domain-containing protein [Opitutaceae bacterium]|nr:TIR domain-containing protein [Opitutaceae bacterium]
MSGPNPSSDDGLTRRAVFLSYAREDSAAAQRIADALRSYGVEVWFDQSELRGGDVWDQKIRRQIKECAIFMPIVSERTQARGEGYFRLEWKLAVERTHLMAEGVPFLAPVVVDATAESAAVAPAEFLRVQWIRLPGSLPTPQFVEQIKRMLEAPRKAGATVSQAFPPEKPRPPRRGVWAAGGIVAAVVLAAVALFVSRHPPAVPAAAPAETPAQAVDPKSIAVLPFENMSEDKQNAFFTDGVHEDVLTNLSFIRDLHLVSRTSVMRYRGTTKPIKLIGQELGVAYVLEGSVRREGNKVRVTGQLINARTDEHVWAKSYDRDLTDIFAIQGELAQAIAGALQAVLSPETKVLLARRPTENTAAYDAYLKARQARYYTAQLDSRASAISFLEDAVRLDPAFAPAWAQLGSLRGLVYFNFEHTDRQLGAAKEAIDTAVRLAPDDPAVIEGLGDYYYYGYRDYARATEEYMRLAVMRPNDPVMFYSLGLIQRRQGRVADALPNFRKALKLDPTNSSYIVTIAESLAAVHLYDESQSVVHGYMETHPQNLEAAWIFSTGAYFARGSTAEIQAFAHRAVDPSERAKHLYMRSLNAAVVGDWAEFARIYREQPYYDGNPEDPRWSQEVNAAENFAEAGDMGTARTLATDAVALMKAELERQPKSSALWASLSLAHALLGDKEEALRCAQKSSEILPESRDAIVGPSNSGTCAFALAWMGEKERALEEIERLLRVPWGINVYASRVSFRPLRDEPRFKALVADTKANDPLL